MTGPTFDKSKHGLRNALLSMLLAGFIAGCNLEIPSSIGIVAGDASAAPVADAASTPPCTDFDNDGICASAGDCNDFDPTIRPGIEEICNGIDDDCDQQVDEDVGEGEVCFEIGDDCTLEGVRVCDPEEGLICEVIRDPEICNNLDDDCDGVTDEGNPGGGGPCDAGGVGACGAGTFVCSEGTLGCLPISTPGSVNETCNGIDDDCDGNIDEASLGVVLSSSCYGGPPDSLGVGKCAAGTWQCLNGRWGTCVGEQRPTLARCDSTDDWDCNGTADFEQTGCVCTNGSTESCYGGPDGTLGVGICNAGTRTCVANVWAPCGTHYTPLAETCDGFDEDCDGVVDEGFDVGAPCTAGLGTCTEEGVRVCAVDGLSAHCDAVPGTPVNENSDACNGLDDDCDGRIDEALAGLGGLCSNDLLGACARPGALVCDIEAEDFVCNAPAAEPSDEICNGIDDDCDGTVDNGFLPLGTACTVGVGACSRTGTYICSPVNGTRICDVQPGGPSAEVCDSLDNDCDGQTDEGFGVGNACEGIGECGLGVVECNLVGGARCSTSQGGSQHEPVAESCNGLDDDCDGEADENFYGLGNACYGCGSAPGVWECKLDGTTSTCSTGPGGSAVPPEICGDLLDNDCDYTTDEESCVDP